MIRCAGRFEGNPFLGTEFFAYCEYRGLEYECHEDTDCNECVLIAGHKSPITGKAFRGNRQKYIASHNDYVGCYDAE